MGLRQVVVRPQRKTQKETENLQLIFHPLFLRGGFIAGVHLNWWHLIFLGQGGVFLPRFLAMLLLRHASWGGSSSCLVGLGLGFSSPSASLLPLALDFGEVLELFGCLPLTFLFLW